MNPRVIAMSLLLTVPAFCVRSDPIIDLIAGWRWMPLSYYYGDFYQRPSSYWRLGAPFGGSDALPFSGYPPAYWHFDHYMRLRLNSAHAFPDANDSLLPPLAGTAPLDLRDPQREATWTREINSLLGSFDQLEWPFAAATNAPPPVSVP